MPALSTDKPATILVTGATGYIGAHIALAALQSFPNYKVRGTVRTEEKAKVVREALFKQGVDTSEARLELVYVDDLLSEDQISKAMKDVQGVVHVALPTPSESFVEDATASFVTILNCAEKAGTVERVVLTSSSCASVSMPCSPPDRLVDAETWNDSSIERWKKYKGSSEEEKKAVRESKDGAWFWLLYEACKTASEREAWKWMAEHKPSFDLVVLLPNANFGPVLYGAPTSTAAMVASLLENDDKAVGLTQSIPSQWYVDVRDCALVHLRVLSSPEVANKRIWTVAGPWGWNTILDILRKNFPGKSFPPDVEAPDKGPTSQLRIEHDLATKLVGKWIGLEKSVMDTVKGVKF